MEVFIRSVGWGVNQIGEGLRYPIYGGKNSLVLRSEHEVVKKEKYLNLRKRVTYYK